MATAIGAGIADVLSKGSSPPTQIATPVTQMSRGSKYTFVR